MRKSIRLWGVGVAAVVSVGEFCVCSVSKLCAAAAK